MLNVLIEVIESDRYPMSPRIRLLQEILGKFGEVGGLPPELAARVRRYAPHPQPGGRRQRNAIPRGGHARDEEAGKTTGGATGSEEEKPPCAYEPRLSRPKPLPNR